MKFLLVLTFLFIKSTSECCLNVTGQNSDAMSLAVGSILRKLFMGKFTNIRILSSIQEEMRVKSYELVSDLIVKMGTDFKVTIEEPKIIKNSPSKRGSPMVILIHSWKSFEQIREKLEFDNLRFRKFYLLVLVNGIFPEIERVVQSFWKFWINNINVLYENRNGSIGMFTFFPFANQSCGNETSLKLINTFNVATRTWSTKAFVPEKFRNLNLCSLKLAVQGASAPSVIIQSDKFFGFEVDIFNEIADEFNSTTSFEDFKTVGSIYENGTTTTGMLPQVYKRTHVAAFGTLSLQLERTQFLTETKSFLSLPIVLVIPPAKIISPFQKLVRPFTILVWSLLLLTFLIGFIIIITLKCSSRRSYDFIVGPGVNYPFTNMMIAFFGGTQSKIPSNNFARYLLMNFLLFCLVIRVLYQGKLFLMLRMELHEKEAATIDDMMEREMIFYTYESLSKRTVGFKFFNRWD